LRRRPEQVTIAADQYPARDPAIFAGREVINQVTLANAAILSLPKNDVCWQHKQLMTSSDCPWQ
jgi:hypothetical protein